MNKTAEYMAANPPPTHTGRDDCQCRQCFFTEGKRGYWTEGVDGDNNERNERSGGSRIPTKEVQGE